MSSQWTLLDDTCNGRFGTPGGITRWNILSGTTGNCLNFEGEPRDGVKVIATHSAMVLEIIPVGDHEPDHYRYVESTPGDLPLLKIGLQHLLAI